ncbi:MAG: LysR family transcriptional regulator [Rhodospirillaceae bacterium]
MSGPGRPGPDGLTAEEAAALRPYATGRQAEILDAIEKHGSMAAASKALGLSESAAQKSVRRLKARAAAIDPNLHGHKAPEGYHLRGVSSLVDAEGNVRLQWRKTAADPRSPETVLAAFRASLEADPIPPAPPVEAPSGVDPDRVTVYPMGDPHVGMYSWHEETGHDFDLGIAERNLSRAVDHLVALAPPTEHAVVINLGDMLHADNQAGVTARSGHALDVDSRWQRVMVTAIRIMHRTIDRALSKHQHVSVFNAIGNHDDLSSLMLALALAERYRDDPRVTVDTSPNVFRFHRFGDNLIGVTHGNGLKIDQLPGIMAHDVPKLWGETRHRFWYVGHVHHTQVKEVPGCTVESFRTLAPRDAWHNAKGYRSGRDMVCDVLHRKWGRVLRHTVGIDMLEGQA